MTTPREAKDAMGVVMNEFGLNSATAVRKEYPASWGAVVLWDERDGKVTTNKLVAASVCRRLLEAASRRVAELEERLATSELEAKRLREALAWYADPANYLDGSAGKPWSDGEGGFDWDNDDGSRARAALAGSPS